MKKNKINQKEIKKYEKELKDFRKNGYIKTTKENIENFDFSKLDKKRNNNIE